MAADGSVVIEVKADIKKAQAELTQLEKQIEKTTKTADAMRGERSGLVQAANEAKKAWQEAEMEAQQAKQAWLDGTIGGDRTWSEAQDKAAGLKAEYEAAHLKVKEIDEQIAKADLQTERLQEDAAKAAANLAQAKDQAAELGKNTEGASAGMSKFTRRVMGLISRVFVFSLITSGLRAIRAALGDVITRNTQASAAFGQLKGALMVMAQPILQIVIPALTLLAQILTRVILGIARLFALLTGSNLKDTTAAAKAMQAEGAAIKGAGKEAEKASKSFAAFDEINQIGNDTSSAGGGAAGGGGAADSIAPNFDFTEAEGALDRIWWLVEAIAAGFAAWKIGKALNLDLIEMIGLAVALYSAIQFVKTLMDAWENGVSLEHVGKALTWLLGIVLGLAVAFGSTAAGIALVVGGASLIITAFRDMIKNGANWANVLMLISGLLSGGIGIGILTGHWGPMLIGLILSIIAAVVMWEGNMDELVENLKLVFEGITDFISGVFAGDWAKAWEGIKKVFKGIWNSIIIIVESCINGIIDGINLLIDKINSAVHIDIPDWIPLVGGQTWSPSIPKISGRANIPRLAQGAVIPPNREFMAVLGDQTSGTNIEAPLETMVQAFRMALAEGGIGRDITVIMELDRTQFGKVVYRANTDEVQRVGVKLAEVR